MAYNNGFPMNYGQYYPQYQQQNGASVQQSQGGIIWVQGEPGAKSYLVAPNTTVQLWDSERQSIYLKSADASGMPSMKILDYTIREQTQPTTQAIAEQAHLTQDFVTHKELNDFEEKIIRKFDELKEETGV